MFPLPTQRLQRLRLLCHWHLQVQMPNLVRYLWHFPPPMPLMCRSLFLKKKQLIGRPFGELQPADFALDDDIEDNAALSAANNGGNAGADLSRLEKLNVALPPETAAVTDTSK